jgi:hypothetical protein
MWDTLSPQGGEGLSFCILASEYAVHNCHRFRSNEVRLWLSVIAYNRDGLLVLSLLD